MIRTNFILTCYFVLLIFFSHACSGPGKSNSKQKPEKFYDLEGLIKKQISLLDSIKPKVQKQVFIDDQNESKKMVIVNWKKELNLFSKADINKPKLLDKYTINSRDTEGEQVTVYQNIDNQTSGVAEIIVVKNKPDGDIKSLKIESKELNTIFVSEIQMEMAFESVNGGEERIKSYTIAGIEKTILKDTTRYKIDTDIFYEK